MIGCKRLTPLFLLLVCSGLLQAQEIKFIDLSSVQQRTALRFPPAQPDCVPNQGCGEEATEVEALLTATGLVPIDLPVSPHLSDLQPADEWQTFQYLSLALEVRLSATEPVQALGLGYVELYGSVEHEDTMVTLKPGQWIRVKANLKLHTWPSEPVEAQLRGDFWIHKNVYKPHEGGAFTEAVNDYPNHTTLAPTVTVRFSPTHSASQQAQPSKP